MSSFTLADVQGVVGGDNLVRASAVDATAMLLRAILRDVDVPAATLSMYSGSVEARFRIGAATTGMLVMGAPSTTPVDVAIVLDEVASAPVAAVTVVNADDDAAASTVAAAGSNAVSYGLDDSAQLQAVDLDDTITGSSFTLVDSGERLPVRLRILGERHVMATLAALAAARALGVPLASAIAAVETVPALAPWHMELLSAPGDVTVINDAHDASTDTVGSALKTLAQIGRGGHRTIAVLGEIDGLGEFIDENYYALGKLVVRLNIASLVVVGQKARHLHNAAGLEGSWDGESTLVDTAAAAEAVLRDQLRAGDVVLVKASASAGLRDFGDRLAGVTR
ncbi:glutamate ligase domain-containing protein [Marisediminicola senii]|uniref:glutamate ligase domain-containing protein n=1 Tax=Marisediminicola senii TaxID=2711233 RepID=UPI0013E9CFF3|nr:Mur ligase family protein [Marisediminicola senii]